MVFKWNNPLFPTFEWESRPPREPQKGLCLPKGAHIPDWKSYKVSEFTPDLQRLEKRLAAKGLKDPWIRNEVWRMDTRMWGTTFTRSLYPLRGSGCAVLLTIVLITVSETFFKEEHHEHVDKYPLLKELSASRQSHH